MLERVFHSVFVMATSRTSGFGLIDQQSLGLGAAVLLIVFMWIGGGPMSTAGGVKTVTLSVAFFSLASTLKGLGRVEALGREISSATVMPLILRGVSLLGVSSGNAPAPLRRLLWEKLASDWKAPGFDKIPVQEVDLEGLTGAMKSLLERQHTGRTVVRLRPPKH